MSKDDHVLNVSPSPHHENRLQSSDELAKEIAILEIEIDHLERYLLSLYRTAFKEHLPSALGQTNGTSPPMFLSDPSPFQKTKSKNSKDSNDSQSQRSSTTCPLARPNNNSVLLAKKPLPTERETQSVLPRHRSLADHLRNSRIDDALTHPDRLSEEIIRCISSIYCKLANPTARKGFSVSSASSSFCSSGTFSPKNLSGSSSQCNEEFAGNDDDVESAVKQEETAGPYASMVEVLGICLDGETYNCAETMLQRFRSLLKSLELVDPKKMKREEKLAFWINVHNALFMHAYLAYGTQHCIKSTCVVKAAYNIGGHSVNAHDIQSSILGIRSHYSSPWLQTLLSPGKKFKTRANKHAYSLEYPEPLVHFALCSGAYSDPAIRAYKADNVFEDLKVAKEEFIQATVYVHKETKIYLPKILSHYAKDSSMGIAQLLEMISRCVSSGIQQKAIRTRINGGNNDSGSNSNRPEKFVYWLEQSSSFRYFIHNDAMAETRSSA